MKKDGFVLIITLILIVVSVVSLTISQLYSTAFDQHKEQLTVIAQSQAKLIESMAQFDSINNADIYKESDIKATLSQISKAYSKFEGFGKSGEINIGKLENGNVVFLLQSRLLHEGDNVIKTLNRPIPIGSSEYAIPMQKALMGISGTTIGSDYNNIKVLSAHEPIHGLNYGVVVKIDLSEVREPYINAGIISVFLSIILIVIGSFVFINIYKKSSLSLKNSEEKHRAIIENLNDVVFILNKDGICQWCSATIKKQFGLYPENVIGTNILYYTQPDGVELLKETLNYSGNHPNKVVTFDSIKAVNIDNELRYLSGSLMYLPNTPGINGVVVVVHNNTDQYLAQKRIEEKEQKIKSSENQYRMLVETMQEGIGMQDNNGIVTYVNPQFCNMLGLTPDEALGRHVNTFFDEENLKILESQLSEHKSGKNTSYEIAWLHKDGHNISTIMSPRVIIDEDGIFKGSFGVLTDITDRKVAEVYAQKSIQQLKEAQKIALVGSWEYDLIENNLKWSDEIYRIFNFKPQEFLPDLDIFTECVHPDDRYVVNKTFYDALINKKPYEISHRLKLKNGEIKYVHEVCQTFYNEDSEPLRSIGTVQDITEKTLAEIEIKKHKFHLEELVNEATEELKIKNKKLEKSFLKEKESKKKLNDSNIRLKFAQDQMIESEKMASIGQLTAGIAHEINNPVNFIGAGINSMEKNLEDMMSLLDIYNQINPLNVKEKIAEIKDYKAEIQFNELTEYINQSAESIKNGVERTNKIIKGLSVFSHNDQEKTQMSDINNNLDATLTMLHSLYKDKNIEINKNYGDIPRVNCYSGRMNQVFLNIITNALHAIDEKNNGQPGIITITTEKFKNKQINEVVIKIKDNGSGIPDKIKKKIFDPFYTTKEVGKGTGLGLSISYGIVKNHHGRIKVNSTPNEGTEFDIYIPVNNK